MDSIDVLQVDLNLLVALDALLRERHVTRAARRLGITQSSASHALGRLRELFSDPILVKSGRTMVPTPRAEGLAAPLARILDDVARVLRDEGAFDPATSTRTFRLMCPDLLAAVLPELLAALAARAPGVSLDVSPSGDLTSALASGAHDLALAPAPSQPNELMQRLLGTIRFGVLARRDHPAARGRLTTREWARYPHIVVRTGSASESFVGRTLREAGVERRVALVVPSFLVAPHVVARTDYLFTAPRELVAPLVEPLGLALLEPPIALPEVAVAALWHERFHADAGHRFFRSIVAEVLERALSPRQRRRRT